MPLMGVDEAGRGCLAGPVVAAAVMLPEGLMLEGLDDSKRLSAHSREALFPQIIEHSTCAAIAQATAQEIDELGILNATLLAMRRAVEAALSKTPIQPKIVVVDGRHTIPGVSFPQRAWPKGDRLSVCCAAASILAKVHRDNIMAEADSKYPGYGFRSHKGYGTKAHIEALERLGPCPIHRRTFAPVRDLKKRPRT